MRTRSLLYYILISVSGLGQSLPARPNKLDANQLRQGAWSIWMDASWQPTNDSTGAVYYRLINYKNDKPVGVTTDFYRDGTKQYEGLLSEDRPKEVQEGVHTWFYISGEKRIIEIFANGESKEQKIFLRSGEPADPEWIARHYTKGERFSDANDYASAIQEFLIAIENAEAFYGRESEEYATVADWLGIAYGLNKNRNQSIRFKEEFVSVRKIIHPQPDTLMLTTLADLGSYYRLEKNWPMAKKRLKEFLNFNSSYFGGNHPSFPEVIQTLGVVCEALREYDNALTYLTDAKIIFDADPKKYEYPRLSNIFSLSGLYLTLGELTKGEQLLFNELKQLRKEYGEKSEIYYTALGLLARLHEGAAKYKQAEAEWSEELRIIISIEGNQSSAAAGILGSLAELEVAQGNLVKADQHIQQARKIYNDQKATDIFYFEFLGKLATIYSSMGNKKAMFETIEERRQVADKLFGNQSLEYARTLLSLADVAFVNSNWNLCERYAQEALLIYSKFNFRKLSDSEKMSLMLIHARLGTLYLMEHLSSPNSLKLTLSKENLNEAVRIFNSNPERIFSLNITDMYLALATVMEMKGVEGKADEYYNYVYSNVRRQWGEMHPYLINVLFLIAKKSEIRNDLKASLTFYQKAIGIHRKYVEDVFPYLSETEKEQFYESNKDVINSFQGFAAKYYQQLPGLSEMWCDLVLRQKGIVLQSFTPIRNAISNSENKSLQAIFTEWQRVKNEYGRLVQNETTDKEKVNASHEKLNELEKELSAQAKNMNLKFKPAPVNWKNVQQSLMSDEAAVEIVYTVEDNEGGKDSIYYSLMIKPGLKEPHITKIASAKQIEGKAFKFYRNAIKLMQPDLVSYNLYWKPLADQLNDVKTVYCSLDGIYHQINLSTLFNPDSKKYLQEEKFIRVMPSSTWLVDRQSKNLELADANLFAHPDYGYSSAPKAIEVSRSLDFENVQDLPGTELELNGISGLLTRFHVKFESFEGKEASEEKIKKIQSPQVLHIATHGFFLPEGSSTEGFHIPLLRSGLLLADCQLKPHLNDLKREDGILTAFEASTLPLFGTKLVVLSACETGLGEIKNGEGVYGLQRAFFMAGAERVLMSLWKVDDEATHYFMVSFYEEWINAKNIDKAFQHAQQSVKLKYTNPFYWGAFILSGK